MRPNFFTAWPAASWASASLVTSSRVASSLLMGAEARGDGVGIAGGGNHRIARLQRGFRDQSAKTPGSSCDEPDTHFLALSIVARRASPNLMGKKLAARHI